MKSRELPLYDSQCSDELDCHKRGKRNFWLQEMQGPRPWALSYLQPWGHCLHSSKSNLLCVGVSCPQTDAELWSEVPNGWHRCWVFSLGQNCQNWLSLVVLSTKGCIYYKLLIRYPAHPKNYLWDLAVYFEVTPQVQALMSILLIYSWWFLRLRSGCPQHLLMLMRAESTPWTH